MYKLDILGLSETWLKKGVEIEIPGYKWAGVEGESKIGRGGGVGFLVKSSLWNQVGEVKKVNSRTIGMFVKVGKKGCWMFQIYAPINNASKEERAILGRTKRGG